jgi:hypothetical protein
VIPVPLPHRRAIESAGIAGARYVLGGMFTPDYAGRAERLRQSCDALGVPHALFELDAVHTSISPRGRPDPALTKANFIAWLLERYRKPILYLDIDCVVRERLPLVDELVASGVDFAIFNWAAEPDNEAFVPVDVTLDGKVIRDRFFIYSHRVKRQTESQLMASGCVQFYRPSPAAQAFLQAWHAAVLRYPRGADDQCLSFAFNNRGAELASLHARWLPKAYARIFSWIDVKPVIDHPELPADDSGFATLPESGELRWFYAERSEPVEARYSETSVIDVRDRLLYELLDGRLVLVGQAAQAYWVAWGMPAPRRITVSAIER